MVKDMESLESVKSDLYNCKYCLSIIDSMFTSDIDIKLATGPLALVIKQLNEDINILDQLLETNICKDI